MVGMGDSMVVILEWVWGGREWITILVMVGDSCLICLRGFSLAGQGVIDVVWERGDCSQKG